MRPFHSPNLVNFGGPHSVVDSDGDINAGNMDGFVERGEHAKQTQCPNALVPQCVGSSLDVMTYHTDRELPNYWQYAKNYVLQDNLFELVDSNSVPAHLYMVSGWSARCPKAGDPMSCVSTAAPGTDSKGEYDWTDVTYLLHANGISWKYYVNSGAEPDCRAGEMQCAPSAQGAQVPSIWNPLPLFSDVKSDVQLDNIVPFDQFYIDAAAGNLPQVAWIVPNEENSEHPPASISNGQAYVTGIINAIMESPSWSSTAIFLSWDDWGGFYDHINPPQIDANGYGLRVPGLVISPYAKRGFIDHQILSHDAYLKFIEDTFMTGQRLDPATDGRPDARPTVRENATMLGNLMEDFDFTQSPLPPLILDQYFNYSSFLYVANGETNDISAFRINARSGALSPLSQSRFPTAGQNPVALAHDPQTRFLFAANKNTSNISAFRITAADGVLLPVQGSPFATGNAPIELLVDASGGYLFALNQGSNDLWTYTIDPVKGTLAELSTMSLAQMSAPTQLTMDSSGRFLYIASSGSQLIFGFIFDNSNGNLTPITGSPFETSSTAGPLGLVIDPLGRWVFSSDGAANTVSQFDISYKPANPGLLIPAKIPHVPTEEGPSAITLCKSDPTNWAHLFVVNNDSNTLSAYLVNLQKDTLAPLSNSPYAIGATPTAIGCDETDGYLYIVSAEGIWSFAVAQTLLSPVKGSPFASANGPRALDIVSTVPVGQLALSTTTTLSSSLNPSAFGQPVSFTATVGADTGPPPNGEKVIFDLGTSVLGTASMNAGRATWTTSTLAAGPKAITAVYAGDLRLPGSTSRAMVQVINKATSTTLLTSSLNPTSRGQTVTFTATVSTLNGLKPTGTVCFMDGGKTLAVLALGSGKASYSTSSLGEGAHSIKAVYQGTANITGSTSAALVQQVNP
jgi:phospholipase C